MKFYDREEQLKSLREMRELSYNGYSRLTVVTGRRRIGKTTLIKEAYKDEPYVYLFVGRKSESVLCGEFCEEYQEKTGVFVPPMSAFRDVFRFLMEEGKRRKYTLVFDEFQNFLEVNPSIYNDIQNWWDKYQKESHVNMVVSGSVYSLMEKSFPTDERRPYEKQKALLSEPMYSIYGVKPDSGGVTAFITVWQFEHFAYVEHFAVDPDCRGSGIGSAVLRELVSELSCTVCLEVELPENDIAKRRIAFYERNGFVTNSYPYIQPPYAEEQSPLPLIIMTSGRTVSEDEFEVMKGLLYKKVYKVN